MKNIIIIFCLTLMLISCYKTTNKIPELVAVDSLGWNEESDDFFTNIWSIKKSNDRFYVLDKDKISIYESSSFKKITEFGSPGKAPGEYLVATDLAFDRNNVLLCDAGNKRIQRFSNEGKYISSSKISLAWNINNFADIVYINTPFHIPNRKIFSLQNDSIEIEISNIDDLIMKADIERNPSYFTIFNDTKILVFNDEIEFYEIANNELKPMIMINDFFRKRNISATSNIVIQDNKLYMIATEKQKISNEKIDNSKQAKELLEATEYLISIDRNYDLEIIGILPNHILAATNCFVIEEQFIIVKDFFENVIYKLSKKETE